MAKTYTAVPNVATGDVYTSSSYNTYTAQNINNLRVPPTCIVRRTSDLNPYTTATEISWSGAYYDTESPGDPMFAAGSPTKITIRTAGLYLVDLHLYVAGVATMTFLDAQVWLNGSNATSTYSTPTSTAGITSVCGILPLAVGDYLSAVASISGGSNYSIKGTTSERSALQSRLSATWIGQTS